MSVAPDSLDATNIRVRIEYQDAAGNWHATFAIEREDGRRVRGEAVHDPKLGRTLFDEDSPGLLPGDVRAVKRAVAAACAEKIKAESKSADTSGRDSHGG